MGFSLLETLIATGLTLTVTAGLFTVLNPSQGAFSSELELADIQQRLRVGADALARDIAMAGAGGYAGAQPTALLYDFAPVLPYRQGANAGDPPGTFRSDRITVLHVPSTTGQTTVPYIVGDRVVEMRSDTYSLKVDPVNQLYQLMHYDGTGNSDVPVIEHVVGLSFDYYGEPLPPTMRAPLSDPAARTTYGPKPSPVAAPPFGAGENCVFVNDGSGTPAPRLSTLGTDTLVPLSASLLTDGPWCPDDSNANRWDADLLRVRQIAITLRVEAAAAAMRGPASLLFANGGTSRSGGRWLPDQEIRFQISPRNLSLAR